MALAQTQVSGHVLYTIGYGGKNAARFLAVLRDHRIDVVVDVRRWPTTRAVAYADKPALRDYLVRHGIAYMHVPALAPPASLLNTYKRGLSRFTEEAKWRTYAAEYPREIDNDPGKAAFCEVISSYRAPCFMCAESLPAHCHRRLLVEWMREWLHLAAWAIQHL